MVYCYLKKKFSYNYNAPKDFFMPTIAIYNFFVNIEVNRAVAQLGSAPPWGGGGRRFKSCQSDHLSKNSLINNHMQSLALLASS